MEADTIFAVASGAGYSAIAVMRISGPASRQLLAALCGRVPSPRRCSFRRLRDADGTELDQAMVVWLPGPGSYTGEDSAELFLHGGRAVIDGVAEELVRQGARPAEPGEFTRRAFLNGRMDLTEAEAVHDLVAAETAAQRRQALRQLDGALGAIYRGWADRLRALLAQQEALIDFPDEDLPPEVEASVLEDLAELQGEVAAHLDDGRRGERLREGLVFAVTGRPNVGKSSLVNALAERDVAIVSAVPGTTRDALETRVVLRGVPVTLVDTAGLRESSDAIEAEGVRRARARAAEADLVVAVTAPGDAARGTDDCAVDRTRQIVQVMNKLDLGGAVPAGAIGVSALTGEGLDALRARLAEAARSLTEGAGPPPLTQARHRAALQEAAARLADAGLAELPELRAEDLRVALRALGRITGSVGVEDILDTLFARFCIGK
jgi:tRNA modification GTPase